MRRTQFLRVHSLLFHTSLPGIKLTFSGQWNNSENDPLRYPQKCNIMLQCCCNMLQICSVYVAHVLRSTCVSSQFYVKYNYAILYIPDFCHCCNSRHKAGRQVRYNAGAQVRFATTPRSGISVSLRQDFGEFRRVATNNSNFICLPIRFHSY